MKAHCIAYPIKILLFFQNEAKTADSSGNEFTVKVYLYMTTVHITFFIVLRCLHSRENLNSEFSA